MILIVQDYDSDETTDAIIERFKSISLVHCQHTY